MPPLSPPVDFGPGRRRRNGKKEESPREPRQSKAANRSGRAMQDGTLHVMDRNDSRAAPLRVVFKTNGEAYHGFLPLFNAPLLGQENIFKALPFLKASDELG